MNYICISVLETFKFYSCPTDTNDDCIAFVLRFKLKHLWQMIFIRQR